MAHADEFAGIRSSGGRWRTNVLIYRYIPAVFIFFALTPWTSWGLNEWDSQPWTLFLGCVYIIFHNKRLFFIKDFSLFIVMLLVGVFFAVMAQPITGLFPLLRGVASYLTIPVVVIVFIDIIYRYGFPLKMIVAMNIIWLLVAVIQVFQPNIFSFIGTQRTSSGRGVTSLAAEPTYFAVFLIFISWILLISRGYRPGFWLNSLIIANVLAIVFLAKSAMGILILLIFLSVLFSFVILNCDRRVSIRIISFLSIAVFVFSLFISLGALEGSRVHGIFSYLKSQSIADLVRRDESINVRVENVILPIHASAERWLVPGGFFGYAEERNRLIGAYKGFFWGPIYHDKIMSWVGSLVYELGLFGLMSLIYILYWSSRCSGVIGWVEVFLLSAILLVAIPVAFPLVGILISSMRMRKFAR